MMYVMDQRAIRHITLLTGAAKHAFPPRTLMRGAEIRHAWSSKCARLGRVPTIYHKCSVIFPLAIALAF